MSAYKIQKPGITQKKAYNIQNKAKVWNREKSGFIKNPARITGTLHKD
jgi:hypothetical protein